MVNCIFTFILTIGFLLYNNCAAKNTDCTINVKVCTSNSADGYIEIDNSLVDSWKCSEHNQETYHAAFASMNCKLKKAFKPVTENFVDNLYKMYQEVPDGGYFAMVSAHSTNNYAELWTNPTKFQKIEGLLKKFGSNPQNMKSFSVVTQKRYRNNGKMERLNDTENFQLFQYKFPIDEMSCIEPLSFEDSQAINPHLYGITDRQQHADYKLDNRKLHLAKSEPLACSRPVYGWQYIPANPGDVYFTVTRKESNTKLKHIGSTKLTISETMILESPSVNYLCIKNDPIYAMQGDLYGFYTENYEDVDQLSPLKRVYPLKYTTKSYPCGPQKTWADAYLWDIYDMDRRDTRTSDDMEYTNQPITHYMNVAIKPILRPDFMYTCFCKSDSQCQEYGDVNMACLDGQCSCVTSYVFDAKANKCLFVHGGFTAYMSSVMGSPKPKPANAIDGNSLTNVLTGTHASTPLQLKPWFVLDLGSVNNVFGVKIRVPQVVDWYVEVWETRVAFDSFHSSVASIHDSLEDVQTSLGFQVMEVIKVRGMFPWLIINAQGSGPKHQILNPMREDDIVYHFGNQSTNVLFISAVKSIYKLNVITLQSSDKRSCVGLSRVAFSVAPSSAGQLCSGPTYDKSLYLYEKTAGTSAYILINEDGMSVSMDGNTLKLNYAAPTAFKIYKTKADATSGSNFFTLEEVVKSDETYILGMSGSAKCLQLAGNAITVGSQCSSKFYLHRSMGSYDWKKPYNAKWKKAAHNAVGYISVDTSSKSNDDGYCFQISSTTKTKGGIGAAIRSIDTSGRVLLSPIASSGKSSDVEQSEIVLSESVPGFANGKIGVSARPFDGEHFSSRDYQWCSEDVMTIPGDDVIVNCQNPLIGRYVSLYIDNRDELHSIKLSDIKVFTLPLVMESVTEADCQLMGPCNAASGICQELCINDPEEKSGYHCDCLPGQHLNQDMKTCFTESKGNQQGEAGNGCPSGYTGNNSALACTDVNECRANPNICDQTCINTLGSYYCLCHYGHVLGADGKSCFGKKSVMLIATLTTNYRKAYSDRTTSAFITVTQEIQKHLLPNSCKETGDDEENPVKSCVVDRLIMNQFGKVSYSFYAVFSNVPTDAQRCALADQLKNVPDETDVENVKYDKTTPAQLYLATAVADKDMFGVTFRRKVACGTVPKVCFNGGEAQKRGEGMKCICQEEYYGDECQVHISPFSKQLSYNKQPVVAAISVLYSGASVILLVSIVWLGFKIVSSGTSGGEEGDDGSMDSGSVSGSMDSKT